MAVGYGNHEDQAPGESADPKVAAAKPAGGGTDRPGMEPGMDLGGAGDKASATGAKAGEHPVPSRQGAATGSGEAADLQLTDASDDHSQTPGTGALPTAPQGDEVDPGAG